MESWSGSWNCDQSRDRLAGLESWLPRPKDLLAMKRGSGSEDYLRQ